MSCILLENRSLVSSVFSLVYKSLILGKSAIGLLEIGNYFQMKVKLEFF